MPKRQRTTTTRERQTVELTIESLGFEGKAIARHEGLVYFVEGGIVGDVVLAEVRATKKNHAEAVITSLVKPSEHRIKTRCQHFGVCGGCKWQHLAYREQLHWKRHHIRDAFERLGKVPFGELLSTLASPEEFFYRNKMEYSFGDSRWLTTAELAEANTNNAPLPDKHFALGLHIPGRFDKVLDVQECFLQTPLTGQILEAVRRAAKERAATIFQTRTHEGFLRNLVVRLSRATGELMVILVTSPVASKADESLIQWFGEEFSTLIPQVTTAVHAITRSKATIATGETTTLTGTGFITEEILGVRFRVSPFSFFQTNTLQTNQLFATALEFAGLGEHATNPQAVVWDLYCGAGSITLPAARRAAFVAGIELSEHSIADARTNAQANGISNVEFYAEDMHKAVQKGILARLPKPDSIIVDPPRAGMHPEVVRTLAEIAPPVISYVSCNPTTQARDCALLAERYTVERIQPVDMFPHTYHIESVARLVRKD
jgi:23S rRNA (uracil1939-C5)-methyltransferase